MLCRFLQLSGFGCLVGLGVTERRSEGLDGSGVLLTLGNNGVHVLDDRLHSLLDLTERLDHFSVLLDHGFVALVSQHWWRVFRSAALVCGSGRCVDLLDIQWRRLGSEDHVDWLDIGRDVNGLGDSGFVWDRDGNDFVGSGGVDCSRHRSDGSSVTASESEGSAIARSAEAKTEGSAETRSAKSQTEASAEECSATAIRVDSAHCEGQYYELKNKNK